MKALWALTLLLTLAAPALAGDDWYPERRRSQFKKEPGHIAVPFVYNMPGIGWGYGALGALTNVGGTTTDLAVAAFTGDVQGGSLSMDSFHVIPDHLILDIGGAFLDRATIQSFGERGMESDKNDFTYVEFGDTYFTGTRLTASFFERRLESYLGYYYGRIKLLSLRNNDGDLILESQNNPTESFSTYIFGLRGDFTDDYMDPRSGVRFDTSIWRTPKTNGGPDFYQTDYNLTGFVPIGLRNTWAINYFRSDSHILKEGEISSQKIAHDQGLDCSSLTDPFERQECQKYVDNLVAENSLGSATSLGGYSRMRSYPEGRFNGAHTQFLGTEFRWNITDENTPFDIYFVKDIRTALQVAFFYEIGTVVDQTSDLWKNPRSSYGSGLRVVTASGVVYRIDLAFGDEGFEPSIFFQYPWEL